MKIFLVVMKDMSGAWDLDRRFKRLETPLAPFVMPDASDDSDGPEKPPAMSEEQAREAYKATSDQRAEDIREVEKWRRNIAARKSLLTRIGVTMPDRVNKDDDSEYKRESSWFAPKFACTGDQLLDIMSSDDSCAVESATLGDTNSGLIDRLERVLKKMEDLGALDIGNGDHVYNEKCEVHMPGMALATYNETLLMEDACSDALQDCLNSGWRIIAACPQPNSRRPDYILGRFNPDISTGGQGALRKP